jgi:hypothetical protein
MAHLKLNFSLQLHFKLMRTEELNFKRMRTEELKKEKGTEYIPSPPLHPMGY